MRRAIDERKLNGMVILRGWRWERERRNGHRFFFLYMLLGGRAMSLGPMSWFSFRIFGTERAWTHLAGALRILVSVQRIPHCRRFLGHSGIGKVLGVGTEAVLDRRSVSFSAGEHGGLTRGIRGTGVRAPRFVQEGHT